MSWNETLSGLLSATTASGGAQQTVNGNPQFFMTGANYVPTKGVGLAWETYHWNVTSISVTAYVAAGGYATISDCLVYSNSMGTNSGACDSVTPVTQTTSGIYTITGPTTEWTSDTMHMGWPYVQVSVKSGTATGSTSTVLGANLAGS
ncbi:MAG: hypothetical protein ACRENE_16340 [Polyangiaceae bacterium]